MVRESVFVATLDKVSVDLMVVLGTTSMPVHQVMRLSRGAIIELDATEQDEVKILANNMPVASGVVMVNRNRIAVEVTQVGGLGVRSVRSQHSWRIKSRPETADSSIVTAPRQCLFRIALAREERSAGPCPPTVVLLHRRR
jgi:flagellar motor switch protein FliN/FliY